MPDRPIHIGPSPNAAWNAPTQPLPPMNTSHRAASYHPLEPVLPPIQRRRASSPETITSQPPSGARALQIALRVALIGVIVACGLVAYRIYAFGAAISPQAPVSTQTSYMNGPARVNVVILGYGGSGHDGAYLSDSIMVASLAPHDGATTLISVPRDLWAQVPPGSGRYAKINTAFADGYSNGYDGLPPGKAAAGAEAARKVSDVLGLSVTYWVALDFTGFRQLVDALGGVDINAPVAFTARYPSNDNPQIDASWKTIHFAQGEQHMDGERAIEYARARYVLDPVSEGNDFARSQRQQLLIHAILGRARQPGAWPGVISATDALQRSLSTNLSLADLCLFAQKLDFNGATRIGLSLDNVLVEGQSDDGQAILLPANGDWNALQHYVSAHLKN